MRYNNSDKAKSKKSSNDKCVCNYIVNTDNSKGK